MSPPRSSTAIMTIALVVLVVATRLPQLSSPTLQLDGDEAVLGLMAMHWIERGELPLFFLGQSYGLTLLEGALAAASFLVFGVSAAALKGAMLLPWLAGACFLVAAVRRMEGDRAAWLAVLFVAACPAWGAWSLKARGGYVTAFFLAHVAVWIAVGRPTASERGRLARLFLLGALTGLVMIAQALWAIVLAPFLLRELRRERPIRAALLLAAGALAAVLPLWAWGRARASWGFEPSFYNAPHLLTGLYRLPLLIADTLGGAFFLRQVAGGPVFDIAGIVWSAALAAGVLLAIRELVSKSGPRPVHLSLFGIALTLLVAIPANTPRYLLPGIDLALVLLASELAIWGVASAQKRVAVLAASVVLLGSGAAVMFALRASSFGAIFGLQASREHEAMQALISALDEHGVRHVYTTQHFLPWQLMFAARERILGRWTEEHDRDPRYPIRIDRALHEGEPTALIVPAMHRQRLEPLLVELGLPPPFEIPGVHLVVFDPPRALLERLEFVINEGVARAQ